MPKRDLTEVTPRTVDERYPTARQKRARRTKLLAQLRREEERHRLYVERVEAELRVLDALAPPWGARNE